ncbi:hypothetical protein [Rhizobium sp.]|uniref:hypothetical protein n=1 Tax=Rhizobium sp. TaxID=391 RepID=UPI002EE81161
MREQTKPFVVERKLSRKRRSNAAKPSIWGRLDADIAQDLQEQQERDHRDADHAAAASGNDRV